MPKRPKGIVIYRLGSLGDTVVALPCFNKIMECFPDAKRIALTNIPVSSKAAPLESILGPGGFIHEAIEYRIGTRSLHELRALQQSLHALKIDTLIYLGGGRSVSSVYRDILFFHACGFRKIIGAPTTRNLSFGRIDPLSGATEYEGARLARCLAALGPIDIDSLDSRDLRLTAAEREKAAGTLQPLSGQPFFAINTGGKLAAKDWGIDRWRELLARLAPNFPLALVPVGDAADRERAKELGRLWRYPVINACGKLNPRETAALLQEAALFVGHDSGPLHLAATMGVRCIGLFGPNNKPAKWHPPGPLHTIFHHSDDLKLVRAAHVENAVLETLNDLAVSRWLLALRAIA